MCGENGENMPGNQILTLLYR